jgi:excisionase family DNA binding protein
MVEDVMDDRPLTASQLLTADDLAHRWQVDRSHIYKIARSGDLPVVRIGRVVRFRADDIEAWEMAGGSHQEDVDG